VTGNGVGQELALIEALRRARGGNRVLLAAALGDARDADGDEDGNRLLRGLLHETGPGSRDLRCAALLALAKRCGAQATADLVDGLHSRDSGVREYAALGLAGAGDDRGWEEVFTWLVGLVRRAERSGRAPGAADALLYLARTTTAGTARALRLVDLVRSHPRLLHLTWVEELWPQVAVGGPPPDHVRMPDPDALARRARRPLFDPL
jgi:HEAT repeat protein